MYLGTYDDIRQALDELFPGKQAYTDDNHVVFGEDEDGPMRACIHVRKSQRWEITILTDDGSEQTIEHVVPSARP